jgi:thiol:disulfide interchange protein DsbA
MISRISEEKGKEPMNHRIRSMIAIARSARAAAGCRPGLLLPALALLVLILVFGVGGSLSVAGPTAAGADGATPAYGKGPQEIILFSDYFCPPCMTLHGEIEPILQKLLEKGDMRVVFVDIPGHKQTVLYAKYFLYAIQAAPGWQTAMKARHVLYGLSKQNLAKTEGEIEKAFAEQGVAFSVYDPKPVFNTWNRLIKEHKIQTTPSCVVKFSATDMRRYEGSVEIRNKLLPELENLIKKGAARRP